MFSGIRKRVTYANVAVTLALVFAMSGGAYAASRYVITSTKQISPKVLKSLQGKAGASGAQGLVGAQGAAGPAGPQGSAGAKGENGTNGAAGTSVTSAEAKAKIGPCKEGGSEFKAAAGTTYACNGEKGKEGTFGGQALPAGKTLTGAFAATGFAEAGFPEPGYSLAETAVSFALPVPGEPVGHYIPAGETTLPAGCTGNVHEPGAEEGNLCVFGESESNLFSGHGGGPSLKGSSALTVGFMEKGLSAAKGTMWLEGTWAVTAG